MMKSYIAEICSTDYFTLWSDGEITCDTGDVFCSHINKKDAINFIKKAYDFYKETGGIK